MKVEVSAGGVVFYDSKILLLKKFNGDWVLPKGKIEKGEKTEQTALREVKEETGVEAQTQKYLGEIHYTFMENASTLKKVHKTVYWYLMKTKQTQVLPQREEGFVDAVFLPKNKAVKVLKYDDERKIVLVAIEAFSKLGEEKDVFFKSGEE